MNLITNLPAPITGFVVDVFRLGIWLLLLIAIFLPIERLFGQVRVPVLRP